MKEYEQSQDQSSETYTGDWIGVDRRPAGKPPNPGIYAMITRDGHMSAFKFSDTDSRGRTGICWLVTADDRASWRPEWIRFGYMLEDRVYVRIECDREAAEEDRGLNFFYAWLSLGFPPNRGGSLIDVQA
jgi:hypothetical protein